MCKKELCTSCDTMFSESCMTTCPYCDKRVCKGCMTVQNDWRDKPIECCYKCAKEIIADS